MKIQSNRNLRAANRKVKRLQRELLITSTFATCSTIIALVVSIFAFKFGYNYYTLSKSYDQEVTRNFALSSELSASNRAISYSRNKVEELSGTIEELRSISETLDKENKSLVKSNDEYWEELSQLRERKELYEEFEWALVDKGGGRTDITYEQLKTLPELLEDKKVNSEHLVLAFAMTESRGKATAQNASSTAKGYGQFLNSTSKFVYTQLMGEKNWTPSVALDGDIGLEMICEYINYLYEKSGRDLTKTITAYRGLYDPGYVAKINSYLKKSGTSISELNAEFKKS